MLNNIFKLNKIQTFKSECVASPIFLSIFDKIRTGLGFRRKELKREPITLENNESHEDEWSGIKRENKKGCTHSSDDYNSDHRDYFNSHYKSICLPLLLKEENVLKILKPTEQHLFQEMCNLYNFSNRNSKKELFNEDETVHVDSKLTLLLEVLLAYPEINILNKKLLGYVSPRSKNLIKYVTQFIEIIEQRIRSSPIEERNYRLKLRSASTSLEKSETELIPLKNTLEQKQRRKHHEFRKKISEEMTEYESIAKDTEAKHEENIKKIISNLESEMVDMHLKSREKQKASENEIENYKKKIDKLLLEHAKREKNLRVFRFKTEKEHMAFLIKYDTEIGSLHQVKEDLTEELSNLDKHYKELEEKFFVQVTFYLKMKEDKEALLMRAFAEQMDNFSKNRAARIIQRTWRTYHTRMIALKKKKKSKRK